jgi:hypothetical protein
MMNRIQIIPQQAAIDVYETEAGEIAIAQESHVFGKEVEIYVRLENIPALIKLFEEIIAEQD